MTTTATRRTTTLDIATRSLADVRRAVRATGGRVTESHSTPGAVGYTTITVAAPTSR